MKSMFGLYYCFVRKNLFLDPSGCGVDLIVTETKQYVATEGYPNSYKDSQFCEFHFMAPSGQKFIVLFEDFNLQVDHDYIFFCKLYIMDTHTDTDTDTHTHTHRHTHIHTYIHTHRQTLVIGYVLRNSSHVCNMLWVSSGNK